jgi:hypothetical protein
MESQTDRYEHPHSTYMVAAPLSAIEGWKRAGQKPHLGSKCTPTASTERGLHTPPSPATPHLLRTNGVSDRLAFRPSSVLTRTCSPTTRLRSGTTHTKPLSSAVLPLVASIHLMKTTWLDLLGTKQVTPASPPPPWILADEGYLGDTKVSSRAECSFIEVLTIPLQPQPRPKMKAFLDILRSLDLLDGVERGREQLGPSNRSEQGAPCQSWLEMASDTVLMAYTYFRREEERGWLMFI